MSTTSFKESIDSSWKILLGALKQASSQSLKSNRRPFKSYEQFVAERKLIKDLKEQGKLALDQTNEELEKSEEQVDVTGDWISLTDDDVKICDDSAEENTVNKNVTKLKLAANTRKQHSRVDNSFINYGSSSSDEEGCRKNQEENLHAFSQEESSWESLSSDEDSKTLDDFIKSCKDGILNESDEDVGKFMPYTDLTDCILEQYYPRSENLCRSRKKEYDYKQDFSKNGQFPLEERLPMMQVIDALEDMNKVLKVGKITPRMERILEYKQEYPFTEGYQEEELGWCPWLVFKIERICKRISAKQWPY